ncbi:unnamed protein product, partial [Musa acuminata subsp. burmannicoides]
GRRYRQTTRPVGETVAFVGQRETARCRVTPEGYGTRSQKSAAKERRVSTGCKAS